ncbi:uncharacterized protein C8Q71DRAFT_781281 [Rhodofomes roseus]|uniref:C2H2-type domain-containing protein n=1 Tax=Rhodofomes roseus TaxID=34475 RepID=A0ABQ8K571_9APHY|nr:uncharacterized protein C8Q71DRAFT_781281 [Rhodofomes roseus]KAH9831568.1 hypothetical protein C8Q71DRAFT_781281 [Rhodofomes roseus]
MDTSIPTLALTSDVLEDMRTDFLSDDGLAHTWHLAARELECYAACARCLRSEVDALSGFPWEFRGLVFGLSWKLFRLCCKVQHILRQISVCFASVQLLERVLILFGQRLECKVLRERQQRSLGSVIMHGAGVLPLWTISQTSQPGDNGACSPTAIDADSSDTVDNRPVACTTDHPGCARYYEVLNGTHQNELGTSNRSHSERGLSVDALASISSLRASASVSHNDRWSKCHLIWYCRGPGVSLSSPSTASASYIPNSLGRPLREDDSDLLALQTAPREGELEMAPGGDASETTTNSPPSDDFPSITADLAGRYERPSSEMGLTTPVPGYSDEVQPEVGDLSETYHNPDIQRYIIRRALHTLLTHFWSSKTQDASQWSGSEGRDNSVQNDIVEVGNASGLRRRHGMWKPFMARGDVGAHDDSYYCSWLSYKSLVADENGRDLQIECLWRENGVSCGRRFTKDDIAEHLDDAHIHHRHCRCPQRWQPVSNNPTTAVTDTPSHASVSVDPGCLRHKRFWHISIRKYPYRIVLAED